MTRLAGAPTLAIPEREVASHATDHPLLCN
jgi:hypothetical protein